MLCSVLYALRHVLYALRRVLYALRRVLYALRPIPGLCALALRVQHPRPLSLVLRVQQPCSAPLRRPCASRSAAVFCALFINSKTVLCML